MTVDVCMAYMIMLVSMTLTLMQDHSGRQGQTFSAELSRELIKRQALNLLHRQTIFYVTLSLKHVYDLSILFMAKILFILFMFSAFSNYVGR